MVDAHARLLVGQDYVVRPADTKLMEREPVVAALEEVDAVQQTLCGE